MGLTVGIVGLPNVGKSTIFNALTAAGAQSANYPFCTIEPNVGVVAVPDDRLPKVAALLRSAEQTPADLKVVDIAGLVRGASRGEGLGNQFLANIRETDAILHVVRCFENPDVVHVENNVDPARDIDIVETELLLADLETVERRMEKTGKLARAGQKDAQHLMESLERVRGALNGGTPARAARLSAEDRKVVAELGLITGKAVLYVANVDEPGGRGHSPEVASVREIARQRGGEVVVLAGEPEAEIARLPEGDRAEFLQELGLEEPGLAILIRAAYRLLDLETFFTANAREARAWTIPRGWTAPQAAGRIHSDFERGFIRAETIQWDELLSCGSEHAARSAGKMRSEGRDYVVNDGDVILFRFNV